MSNQLAIDAELSQCERPIILFWGLIDQRMVLEVLDAISTRLHWSDRNPTPICASDKSSAYTSRGQKSLEELPAWAHQAEVLIMPYADLPVTRAMQRLKFRSS